MHVENAYETFCLAACAPSHFQRHHGRNAKSHNKTTTSEASLRFDGRTPKNSVSWSVISRALAAIPCALLPFFISSQSMCTRAPNGFKATSGPVSPMVAPLLRRLYWCGAFHGHIQSSRELAGDAGLDVQPTEVRRRAFNNPRLRTPRRPSLR